MYTHILLTHLLTYTHHQIFYVLVTYMYIYTYIYLDHQEASKLAQEPATNEELIQENVVEPRVYHHHHRDGTVSEKPIPKKRRHHRRKIRVINDAIGVNNAMASLSPQSSSSKSKENNRYYIGGRVCEIVYHSMLDGEGHMLLEE